MDSSKTYQLSIIIVNYNVSYFLDQCLHSVKKACRNISTEIIVVDNASRDDSLSMLEENYPDITVIANVDNAGFSKANNQGIKIAQGEWVLLLNPDTVLAEDTLEKCLDFVSDKPECGGLGIRMINGKGEFLPESKRGLPTPAVAFYKLSGLSKLFPKSKKFNRYHAGHISENENGEVDILSGAFMMIRGEALDKAGLLDETFFMYGEDIDLSYRIQLAGYKNYYFSDSTIIHYKGESTKKSSVNYVFVFYRAMVIFAKKHFGKKNAGLFNFVINSGIYARAFLAIVARIFKRAALPAVDLILITSGLLALSHRWHVAGIDFPENAFNILIPSYTTIWILSSLLNGVYDQATIWKVIKSNLIGTLVILTAYALLPKEWQFSRLFILTGMFWSIFYFFLSRLYFSFFYGKRIQLGQVLKRNFLLIGSVESVKHTKDLLEKSQAFIGKIQTIEKLDSIEESKGFDEIIFCSSSVNYSTSIHWMTELRHQNLEFKLSPPDRDYLIGSNSIDTAGDLYFLEINKLINKENQRKKRFFDIGFAFVILILSPVLIFTQEKKSTFLHNLWKVFTGKKTFIGYSEDTILGDHRLPRTLPGLLSPCDEIPIQSDELCEKLNLLYARDYSIRKDFRIVLGAWKKLSRY